MKITKNEIVFIKEQDYQKEKRKLNKENNYFSQVEIQKCLQNIGRNSKKKNKRKDPKNKKM